MTTSGESARIARKTASETRCVRLIDRTSFAQKAEKVAKDLCTCSASSLVGTRTRADTALDGEEFWALVSHATGLSSRRHPQLFCLREIVLWAGRMPQSCRSQSLPWLRELVLH